VESRQVTSACSREGGRTSPLRPLSHNANPRDGGQDIGTDMPPQTTKSHLIKQLGPGAPVGRIGNVLATADSDSVLLMADGGESGGGGEPDVR
jgi:hypothetical protein